MSATTCIHCGAPLSRAGAKFCTRCGQRQDATPQPPATVVNLPATSATASALPPIQPAPAQPPSMPSTQMLGPNGGKPVQPTLLVQDEGRTYEIALGGQPMTLGRADDNDIVIRSRFVSGHHARVEPDGLAHWITDTGSTNGLLWEGKRLPLNSPLSLTNGDVLRIGDPATGNFVTLTYRNPAAQRVAAASIAQSYPLDPNDAEITIGREGNDIVLDNPQVSRRHAVIERANGHHVLRDVGSTNGTFVNGKRVTQHPLIPGDVIQIGAFKLVYDGDSLDQYDQRGALRIDARNLSRAVARDGKSRLILKDVSLSIAPREFVALVGGSGTGKSTLLNALSGYAPA